MVWKVCRKSRKALLETFLLPTVVQTGGPKALFLEEKSTPQQRPKKSQSQKNRCVFKLQSTKSQVLPQKSQKNRQRIAEEIAEKSLAIFWAAEKFSLRSCRSSSVNFFDFSQGILGNLVGNLAGILWEFFSTHRAKAQKLRRRFRSIFRKKIRSSEKKNLSCHLNGKEIAAFPRFQIAAFSGR